MQSHHSRLGGPELPQAPGGRLPQLAQSRPKEKHGPQGEARLSPRCPLLTAHGPCGTDRARAVRPWALKLSARPASLSVTIFAVTQSSPAPPLAAETRLENQIPPPASILMAIFSYYRHHAPWQQATLLHWVIS